MSRPTVSNRKRCRAASSPAACHTSRGPALWSGALTSAMSRPSSPRPPANVEIDGDHTIVETLGLEVELQTVETRLHETGHAAFVEVEAAEALRLREGRKERVAVTPGCGGDPSKSRGRAPAAARRGGTARSSGRSRGAAPWHHRS
eukprot:CAMPEP_0176162708 /NCGR_PEP_ID=MMETSP0120_2-20121206/83242_1 /TAXON_ID=160619 /ORGANISM="Kryptoperidinium foliaceum, Strain CCMP 1326" /LENGTH=145 /DNA_ID=CAMNT_0017500217 /DNA_START=32 /DNA_END=467 /DNA_ORIENTATION=+